MNMLGRIKIGTILSPRTVAGIKSTGCAVILDCIPLPPEMLVRKDMYDYDCLYIVLTDFGNIFRMSLPEMIEAYEFGDTMDIKARSEMIIHNHQKVLDGLKGV